MNPPDNTYEHIYRAGTSIRRYPENDVVAFAAGLSQPTVTLDLGTGTGRNLIPLLAAAAPNGLVVATDLAASGLLVIDDWVRAIDGERVDASSLPAAHHAVLDWREPATESRRFYRIHRHPQARMLGPAMLSAGRDPCAEHVYLAVDVADMAQPVARPQSVDAIINRGNIFYLPSALIAQAVAVSHAMLKRGGRLLLSLKSTADSRFASSPPAEGSPWRRRQNAGAQQGLEMEFYDEARADALVAAFKVIKKLHLVSHDFSSGLVLADWVFVLES